MEFPVLDITGKQVSKVDLPAYIFEQEINVGLMHQAYTRQMANARLGTHKTLRRGEVNRTTAKVYRQKGTGRARHGSRNAPIYVGGGRSMGPRPRDYSQEMPKKMRRKALRCALSALVRDSQLILIDKIDFATPKTKEAKLMINTLTGGENALVILGHKNEAVSRSIHNLPKSHVILANYLNIRDLLKYGKVILPLDALDVIKTIWGQEG